jgi:hypothetical protein
MKSSGAYRIWTHPRSLNRVHSWTLRRATRSPGSDPQTFTPTRLHADTRRRDGPFDEGGVQSCPCGITTATPVGVHRGLRTGNMELVLGLPERSGSGVYRCPARIREVRAGGIDLRSSQMLVCSLRTRDHLTLPARSGFVGAAAHPPFVPGIRLLSVLGCLLRQSLWCPPFIATRFNIAQGAQCR